MIHHFGDPMEKRAQYNLQGHLGLTAAVISKYVIAIANSSTHFKEARLKTVTEHECHKCSLGPRIRMTPN